ncbi:DUF2630 family protein [Pseudonocardia kunmingensis]|uniref:Uncharacterized protein DUF2630 n=1 Tax=Pseudonocardia kunmingensis TaxID=630975 RepID=A0A543CWV9_9PSEU|nr:DUF2630 family protein [Pseudonocardia kunmingensis]TQM01596.1 uncharacterized protein DUF2630 [Pseudonocardia kunmingensis]
MTSEQDLLDRIQRLVEEEKSLRARRGDGRLGRDAEAERLDAVEIQLDQCWDLLRQRRALQEVGRSPDQAAARPAGEVEGYLS